jgi:hypothetical protein
LEIEDGPGDELVQLNVRIPRWMKNDAIRVVGPLGKSLNDFVRDAVREALEGGSIRGASNGRGRSRPRAVGRR